MGQSCCDEKIPSEDWDWDYIADQITAIFGLQIDWTSTEKLDLDLDAFIEILLAKVNAAFQGKEDELGSEQMRYLERMILLQMVDNHWKDHLLGMDHLREGIGLRGYGQKNPLDEYKKEGFSMFVEMINTVKVQTVSTLLRIQVASDDELEELENRRRQELEQLEQEMQRSDQEVKQQPTKRQGDKVGRNAPCPCGSGKKYKRCCGKKR